MGLSPRLKYPDSEGRVMARRPDHSRDELYALAMNAARGIVERDGIRGLTARNIATAIGYSPGTLYNLFDNLDDLALQINGATLARDGRLSLVGDQSVPEMAESLIANYLAGLRTRAGKTARHA